ncbi:hypothetical protein OB919_14465 [Halobacteria archaeon AArc-curdl1]|uniref:Uncharacterized protein n=1 Tax=Natronosalvus hydrolyticus TaxID=2979988 RepID=A0AAP2ZAU3_9EURY|nr:hypothetical protein [Halobacteria archaeon AArc-curdl1]
MGTRSYTLSRAAARELRTQLSTALETEHEFVRTRGTYRADGTYVITRRGVTSSGHRKVFDDFETLSRRFRDLPETFTANDIDWPGVSGRRRHLCCWHFLEHPQFPCQLVTRQPLTVTKTNW